MKRLIRAGMNVARFNLSHGNLLTHAYDMKTVRTAAQQLATPVAILIDLPGPKYRTGPLKTASVELKRGAEFTLTTRTMEGDEREVSVNFPPTLPQEVRVGDKVLLADGAMQLRVQRTNKTDVKCAVLVGGTLTEGRGVVVPGMRPVGPFITEQLQEQLEFTMEQQPDYLALSSVSKAEDICQVRAILQKREADIPIISKIERRQAISAIGLEEIMKVSDGIMVARGDLGTDIPLERLPVVQKELIRKCNEMGKPVITATEMLESMIEAPRPTRAEVTDVANAVFDGSDAVMLSAETSVGDYPVEAVDMMARIARESERSLPYEHLLRERGRELTPQTDEAISYDACYTAHYLGAKAIVAFTHSGSTAMRVSKYRPRVPILAITPSEVVCRRLACCWGIHAFQIGQPKSVDELFSVGAKVPKDLGLAKCGDLVVITGGTPIGITGTTNLLKVERIA
jgi:pyruvate kinase